MQILFGKFCEFIQLLLFLYCDSSLQVFESENHATIHSDQTKEGLSLFGLPSILISILPLT